MTTQSQTANNKDDMSLLRRAVTARKLAPEKSFNCWGLTAFLMGWITVPRKVTEKEMWKLIDEHSNEDNSNVLVFTYEDQSGEWILVHTAILLSDGVHVLHKDGDESIRIDPLYQVRTWHYGMYYEYERLV